MTLNFSNSSIILATGVFDLLHSEHLKFFKQAKSLGDKLIVGIESDVRVRAMKGENRPVLDQYERLEQLNQISDIDKVFILPEKFNSPADWEKLLLDIKPTIYAVSENTSHKQSKLDLCHKCGVKYQEIMPHNPKLSTTIIINRIIDKYVR